MKSVCVPPAIVPNKALTGIAGLDEITLVCTSLLDEMSNRTESGSPHQISTFSDTWIHLNYLVQAGERNRGLVRSTRSHEGQLSHRPHPDKAVTWGRCDDCRR